MSRLILWMAAGLALQRVGGAEPAWPSTDAECRRELKVDGANGAPVTATTTVFLDDRWTGFTLTDASGAARTFGLLNRLGSRV